MKESELGSMLAAEMRKRQMTVFKLHNDMMQRGLPDYMFWGRGLPVRLFELKVARDAVTAFNALSSGQESVMNSLALSSNGALLVFGTESTCGVVEFRGRLFDCLKNLMDNIGCWSVPSTGKSNTAKILADMLAAHQLLGQKRLVITSEIRLDGE